MGERAVVTIVVMAIAFGSMMISSIAWAYLKRPRPVDTSRLDEIAARLERLEQSVDAIAVETERISEGQRFTTKLLSERTAQEAR